MLHYGPEQFSKDIGALAEYIRSKGRTYRHIYGVPRGGIALAAALSRELKLPLISEQTMLGLSNRASDILVADDVIDSGATRARFGLLDFACLHWKHPNPTAEAIDGSMTYTAHVVDAGWINYFWEDSDKAAPVEDNFRRIFQYVGEDASREGLLETPKRMAAAWKEMCQGYSMKVEDVMKHFDGEGCNEIVLIRDIEFNSLCEHHGLPFIGTAHVAYIPSKRVIGASKLARILDIYAKRLQIQERIGEQVTAALMDSALEAKAAACIIQAKHMCMQCRGIKKQQSTMVTSSMKGVFLEDTTRGLAARAELMALINLGR